LFLNILGLSLDIKELLVIASIGGVGVVVSGLIAFIRETPIIYLILIVIGVFILLTSISAYIWNYKKAKTLYLEDALEIIDKLTKLFISLMSTTNEKDRADIRTHINSEIRRCSNAWMRKQIRLFLDAVVEGIRVGIPITSESSQDLLTEWSDRMSGYAYKHFRSR